MVKLSFLGLGEGQPDEILSGKRRAVTYVAFITFVLIVAAMDADDWVTGGVEFDVGSTLGTEDLQSLNPRMKELCGMSGIDLVEVASELEAKREAAVSAGLDAPPMLGVTITPKFHLGLTRYTQGGTTYQRYSKAAVERDCYTALSDEIDNINAGTKVNNSWWYGTSPFSMITFNATFGLLGFAAFLQSVIYFLFVCIAYDAPYIATHAKTPLAIRYTSLLVVFFIAVPMLYFGTSGIKESFCNAFDPDTRFNGTFCGYQTGFNIGITSGVFAAFQVLLLWLWVPKDVVAGRYEFSAKSAAGFEPVGASGTSSESSATAPSSAGAYQDFGSSTM